MTPSSAPFSTSEIASLLTAAMEAIRGEYSRLPRRVLAFRPAPGEWSGLEVLGHLIEAEQRGFAGRIRLISAAVSGGESTSSQSFWEILAGLRFL